MLVASDATSDNQMQSSGHQMQPSGHHLRQPGDLGRQRFARAGAQLSEHGSNVMEGEDARYGAPPGMDGARDGALARYGAQPADA